MDKVPVSTHGTAERFENDSADKELHMRKKVMTESIDTSVFESNFKGVVLKPGDEGYDERRTVWDAMVDRRPAVITRCVHTDDVVAALHFGRTNHLEIGIRCGGHSILGHAVPEGGLMIDLSLMNKVQVDPHSRRARVQGGALLGLSTGKRRNIAWLPLPGTSRVTRFASDTRTYLCHRRGNHWMDACVPTRQSKTLAAFSQTTRKRCAATEAAGGSLP